MPLGPLNGRDIRTSKVTSDAFIARKIIINNINSNKSNDEEHNLRIKNQKQEQWQEKFRERKAFW